MNKINFRAQKLDLNRKLILVIPGNDDFFSVLPNGFKMILPMPTGMEKEEETELHLVKALSTREFYKNTDENFDIPVPEYREENSDVYNKIYSKTFPKPKNPIRMQPFFEAGKVDSYDMDSEDERWLKENKIHIKNESFERIIAEFESADVSSKTVADKLMKTEYEMQYCEKIYNYWVEKKNRLGRCLMPKLATGISPLPRKSDPYVVFRKRAQKMQTRKYRKNDEFTMEKFVRLKKSFSFVLTLLDVISKREELKARIFKLTSHIHTLRHEITPSYDTANPLPALETVSVYNDNKSLVSVTGKRKENNLNAESKRKRKAVNGRLTKLKTKYDRRTSTRRMKGETLKKLTEEPAENETEGPFEFKPKKDCKYLPGASKDFLQEDHQPFLKYYPVVDADSMRYLGYVRRRVGRGGRILFDRLDSTNCVRGETTYMLKKKILETGENRNDWRRYDSHFDSVKNSCCCCPKDQNKSNCLGWLNNGNFESLVDNDTLKKNNVTEALSCIKMPTKSQEHDTNRDKNRCMFFALRSVI